MALKQLLSTRYVASDRKHIVQYQMNYNIEALKTHNINYIAQIIF